MSAPAKKPPHEASHSNFIRQIVEADLMAGKFARRRWNGKPGSALSVERAPPDPAKIRTRFPPEPNGYLHYGHAKSICLNFGLAHDYGGVCHLRFDDTNPAKEEEEYVDSIRDAVRWLGFDWGDHEYHASDYFEYLYQFAEELVHRGHAYVDSLSAEQMRRLRGTLTEAGKNSPYRERPVEENLRLLREMRLGKFADGEHVLRAKIDMASPNINLRDPAMYRIRHAAHHRTGDTWCIYPIYDWFNERLAEDWTGYDGVKRPGLLQRPLPQQIEFARLNLTYVVLSKRKLIQLVEEKHVEGWDDPRMPTLVGARRRGFTPEGFRLFAERIGVAKADSWIEFSVLEDCSRELWIEREDFAEAPPKGYFRLYPGNKVRLRYGYIIECVGYDKATDTVRCTYDPDTKSGTPGAEKVKVKGNIHWVSARHSYTAEVRLYDRLFKTQHPGAGDRDFLKDLNPDSKKVISAQLEPALKDAKAEEHFQFERHGYFIADRVDSKPAEPKFNRAVTLRDSRGGHSA